jgi:hypothetical protein
MDFLTMQDIAGIFRVFVDNLKHLFIKSGNYLENLSQRGL